MGAARRPARGDEAPVPPAAPKLEPARVRPRHRGMIASFLAILESYLASLPSRDFSIDLASGAVEDRFTSA